MFSFMYNFILTIKNLSPHSLFDLQHNHSVNADKTYIQNISWLI